ncbi:MAG: Asp-tRNA(Asn)/Glu-tRNA(Gln) amidotransferase subunit GatB [Bacteroidota bacterium]
MNLNDEYDPVIGLEVHAQLLTRTKAFCGCSTTFGDEPNSNVCPVCLGMPGTLPVLNSAVVDLVLRMGVALGCTVARRSIFARKNYFYPDLPKGYQISQYEEPICSGGSFEIDLDDGARKTIGLTRIHMEEDAGKSIHDLDADTLVDLNRCGVPLIEIVTQPDLRSPREAYHALSRIRQIVTYLGVCDGNMEEGSLRCDANVSVRRKGTETFGVKTEVKNMNSFRHVERALEFEINRQIRLIEDGGTVLQETLLWDANQNVAVPMRSKEEAHDYRYFPEPDLVPVLVDDEWIARLRLDLPELPAVRRDRFVAELGLPRYDADVLTAEREVAEYFEQALAALGGTGAQQRENAKAVSNWVMTDVLRVVAERKTFPFPPDHLAAMIGLIQNGTISGKIAKEVFEEMVATSEHPKAVVERKGLTQVSDPAVIESVVAGIIAANPPQVQKYVKGNDKVFAFFVGETMKLMKGRANPKIVNEILRRRLDGLKK